MGGTLAKLSLADVYRLLSIEQSSQTCASFIFDKLEFRYSLVLSAIL